MIYLKLRQAGLVVNHKRVDRLYAPAKLQVRRRKRKKVSVSKRQSLVRPHAANEVCSMDFVLDQTAEGHAIKCLTIVDDATQALVRLQGLSPPASERRLFTRYLAATGAAIDDFSAAQRRSRSTSEATGTAVDGQDFETFQALAGRVTAARGVAHRLGLRVCGTAGSDWL